MSDGIGYALATMTLAEKDAAIDALLGILRECLAGPAHPSPLQPAAELVAAVDAALAGDGLEVAQ